ncbi:MAG: tRNA pseudouridine(55) synthase TruB [Coriobacteriia bacterium]|nr:tRNA pseudouridine(55) synthase TruB [Coriobacteriia bacterium]
MRAKRGSTGLSGIIAVDKPLGMTSHDVVSTIRRISGERRVGHCGTLDPNASGLLLVCIGPATRLSNYLTGKRKRYHATVAFGSATDTDDADGTVIDTQPVSIKLKSESFVQSYLAGLVGTHEQVPPAYSAVKRDGVRAYAVARSGKTPELEARSIEVFAAELLGISEHAGNVELSSALRWNLDLEVSKGTYIRALARDIAAELETCAHLKALRRTHSGAMSVDEAFALDEIQERGVEACYLDPFCALGLPVLALSDEECAHVSNGRPLPYNEKAVLDASAVKCADANKKGDAIVACSYNGSLLALYEHKKDSKSLRALTVIPGGLSASSSTARGLYE